MRHTSRKTTCALIAVFVMFATLLTSATPLTAKADTSLGDSAQLGSSSQLGASAVLGKRTLSSSFSSIFQYNCFVFNNFSSSQGGMEGALAVGANATFTGRSGFDVVALAGGRNIRFFSGIPYQKLPGVPAFIVGGQVSGSTCNVYGSFAAIRQSYVDSNVKFPFGATPYGKTPYPDKIIDAFFADAYQEALYMSTRLAAAKGGSVAIEDLSKSAAFGDLRNFANNKLIADKTALVIHLTGKNTSLVEAVSLPQKAEMYDFIIFNIPADTINFRYGNFSIENNRLDGYAYQGFDENIILKQMAEKVVWNCPNATTITLHTTELVGSLIAPNATVSGTGSPINGTLICHNVQDNGLLFHNFPLVPFDWYEVGEPDAGDTSEDAGLPDDESAPPDPDPPADNSKDFEDGSSGSPGTESPPGELERPDDSSPPDPEFPQDESSDSDDQFSSGGYSGGEPDSWEPSTPGWEPGEWSSSSTSSGTVLPPSSSLPDGGGYDADNPGGSAHQPGSSPSSATDDSAVSDDDSSTSSSNGTPPQQQPGTEQSTALSQNSTVIKSSLDTSPSPQSGVPYAKKGLAEYANPSTGWGFGMPGAMLTSILLILAGSIAIKK